jgi:hypothetical protein
MVLDVQIVQIEPRPDCFTKILTSHSSTAGHKSGFIDEDLKKIGS